MKKYTFDLEGFAARHLAGDVEKLAELSLGEIQVRYVERFMLEDYCDAELVPKKLYKGLWHWQRGVSREDYVRACREYVQTATGLIERRGKRMMREVVRRNLQTANERGI